MTGGGLNHLPLVQGIKDLYIRQRVAKEAEKCKTMGDTFISISKQARAAERTKAYHKPRYEDTTTINPIYSQARVNIEYIRCSFRDND